jgi:hypothetical protein
MRTSSEETPMTSERLWRMAARGVALAALLLPGAYEAQERGGVTVAISVYSGRPDPAFELADGAELERLRTMVERAPASPRAEGRGALQPRLGYRGIIVENRGAAKSLPSRITVYGGYIEIATGDKGSASRLDEGRALEEYLLALALKRGALTPKLYDKIKAQGR